MENIDVVERLEALDDLNEDSPNVRFSQVGLLSLVFGDLLEEISIVCILHHDAAHKQTLVVKMKALLYLSNNGLVKEGRRQLRRAATMTQNDLLTRVS